MAEGPLSLKNLSTDDEDANKPVTERSSEKTKSVDVEPPPQAIKMIQACEEEIFNGWKEYSGISADIRLHEKLHRLVILAQDMFKDTQNNKIILSGCGTSGRLALLISRYFNAKLKELGHKPCMEYIIAGGEEALFRSVETSEDDPIEGRRILEEKSRGKTKVLFIGITCGLSAPFVAGQLDFCMDNLSKMMPVLLGFNPVDLARDIKIENWDKTFKAVATRMIELERQGQNVFVINPVIGPEPITGSSRMKGGTATLVILETFLSLAFYEAFLGKLRDIQYEVALLFQCFWFIHRLSYKDVSALASGTQLAGDSLLQHGHVYYVSDTNAGIVGLIDASECPPTFGAKLDDIQGYIPGGYDCLGVTNKTVVQRPIATAHFTQNILPRVTNKDTIVLLQELAHSQVAAAVMESPASVVAVSFSIQTGETRRSTYALRTSTRFAKVAIIPKAKSLLEILKGNEQLLTLCTPLFREISFKFVCNSISTNAFIAKGKVFGNFMVDVAVSNNKLYHRSLGLVARFAKCSQDKARHLLLSSIYKTDVLSDAQLHAQPSAHISAAATREMVVSIAIVVAKRGVKVEEAENMLRASPRIRKALQSCFVGGRTRDRVGEGDRRYVRRGSLPNESDKKYRRRSASPTSPTDGQGSNLGGRKLSK